MNSYPSRALGIGSVRFSPDSSIRGFVPKTRVESLLWSIASSPAFNVSNPTRMTVRMWICPRSSLVNNGLATRSSLASSQGDWAMGFFNGGSLAPTFRVNNNGGAVQSSTVLSLDTWYLLEGSYDSTLATNNLKLFINGVLDTQANYTTAITNNAVAIYLGAYFTPAGNSADRCFIKEFEFCANCVRNTVAYTPPDSLVPDGQTTLLYRSGFYMPM